jgi:hypothetical protein
LIANQTVFRANPSDSVSSWVEIFRIKNGRAPRVLHVGNIANNAYNNALLLRDAGLECDVICYDYYHIMGYPEWEDAEINAEKLDQVRPNLSNKVGEGYVRPRWFAQGSARNCIRYLTAKNMKHDLLAKFYWLVLSVENRTQKHVSLRVIIYTADGLYRLKRYMSKTLRTLQSRVIGQINRVTKSYKLTRYMKRQMKKFVGEEARRAFRITSGKKINRHNKRIISFIKRAKEDCVQNIHKKWVSNWYIWTETPQAYCNTITDKQVNKQFKDLVSLFAEIFSDRNDKLNMSDMEMYRALIPLWHSLFEQYDIIQAYATDPILALLSGTEKPYVAFEHGTLRSHTLCNNSVCRLTSLAYNQADHVFITNGDCLEYANKIKVKKYSSMLHPINEKRISSVRSERKLLQERYSSNYIFFCPLRHDWEIKGTNLYIQAIPLLIETIGESIKIVMTTWGEQVDLSKKLAYELNVDKYIEWIDPLPRKALIKYLKSCDILFDQMALPHFGATAPEGIAAGVPVIMSYKECSTDWIVSIPAPILPAFNKEDIARQAKLAIDPTWRENYYERATEWFDRHHCSARVIEQHLKIYKDILS